MASIQKCKGVTGTSYRVRIKHKGQVVNSATFDTMAEARAWAAHQEAAKSSGRPHDMRTAKKTMFKDVMLDYAKQVSPSKKGGKEEARRVDFLISNFSIFDSPMSDVHKPDIADFRDERLDEVAAQTVQHDLKLMRQAIKHALSESYLNLPVNPLDGIRMPKLPDARERRLESDEYERLLAACKFHPWLSQCITIAIETAMRRGEILSITPAMVDLETRFIRLRQTKSGYARDVPLSRTALEAITPFLKKKKHTQPIFDVEPQSLSRAFSAACDRACEHVYDQQPGCRRSCQPVGKKGCPGIVDLRFHDLRHEAISRFFEKTNLRTEQIMQISGHRTYAMLKRYTHLRPSVDLVDALDAINA